MTFWFKMVNFAKKRLVCRYEEHRPQSLVDWSCDRHRNSDALIHTPRLLNRQLLCSVFVVKSSKPTLTGVSWALRTLMQTLTAPQAGACNYSGIRFPSMLIFTAPCGRRCFLCSTKRRLCFSSRLMPFLKLLCQSHDSKQTPPPIRLREKPKHHCFSLSCLMLPVQTPPTL